MWQLDLQGKHSFILNNMIVLSDKRFKFLLKKTIMYKKILTLFFLFHTATFLMGSKPPLPKEAFHPERVPYELLDCTLKARPFTEIDALEELVEGICLSKSQQEALEKLKKEQELLVEKIKAPHLEEIERLKYILFNKSFFIQRTIQDYRYDVLTAVNQNLRDDIQAFREGLKRRQRE